MRPRSTAGAILLVPFIVASLLGCSALGPSADDANHVTATFGEALDTRDGAGACELLNAAAEEDVESQTGMSCSDGVLELDLTGASDVQSTDVYGRSALVRSTTDSIFLTVVGSAWKIRAVGCAPVTDAPFECTIEGS